MGTNYYHYPEEPCECCQREYEPEHIGKSSYGWKFALHVTDTITSLADWQAKFTQGYIKDEYDNRKTVEELMKIILEQPPNKKQNAYNRVAEFPTYECITGDFS